MKDLFEDGGSGGVVAERVTSESLISDLAVEPEAFAGMGAISFAIWASMKVKNVKETL
jgi:hypothetical protein